MSEANRGASRRTASNLRPSRSPAWIAAATGSRRDDATARGHVSGRPREVFADRTAAGVLLSASSQVESDGSHAAILFAAASIV